jgi:hypothetical protein
MRKYYVPCNFDLETALVYPKGLIWTYWGSALAELIFDYLKGVKDPEPFNQGVMAPGVKWVLEKSFTLKNNKIKEFLFSCKKASKFLNEAYEFYGNSVLIWVKTKYYEIGPDFNILNFIKDYQPKRVGIKIENSNSLGYYVEANISPRHPGRALWYDPDVQEYGDVVINEDGTINPQYEEGKILMEVAIPLKKLQIKINKEKLETLYIKKIYKTLESLNS